MPKLRLNSKFAHKMASRGSLRIILSTLLPYDVSATNEVQKLALGYIGAENEGKLLLG